MFPDLPEVCPVATDQTGGSCRFWWRGYQDAIDDADAGGYLGNPPLEPVQPLTLSDAQALMPSLILVLATAFGARLIIQLVKG